MIHVSGRHLPPDYDAGDESTLGGYMAVHARPAAFEGPDGLPYSVDIGVDEVSGTPAKFGAYLLFLRWRRMGTPGVDTHLETDFLVFADTAADARTAMGEIPLQDVKAHLDRLVGLRRDASTRRWWDVMRDEDNM